MARCISCSYTHTVWVSVRDSAFSRFEESAYMTVCYPCAVEYVETYERMMNSARSDEMRFIYRECFETSKANVDACEKIRATEFLAEDDMEDTMHNDPGSLFFSHREPAIDMSRVYQSRDVWTVLRQRSLIFSETCSGGDKFAANALGSFEHACL